MIYITTSKADGSPCERVYEGTKYTWYYCRTEDELVRSLLNLALADSGLKVYNVYGKEFPGPEGFTVGGTLWELRGFAGDPKRALRLARLSTEFRLRGRRVEAKFYRGVPAEEVLRAGIIVLEPYVLPTLYSGLPRGKAVRPDPKATTP